MMLDIKPALESFEVEDSFDVAGRGTVYATRLGYRHDFKDIDAMREHLHGRMVSLTKKGKLYRRIIVAGVECFARGGRFRTGEPIGLLAKDD